MRILKVSQIQFQAKATPIDNAKQLERYFKKTLKFRPDIICTPECSNIITNNNDYLFKYSTYEKDCPILNMSKKFAKMNKININIGSLLLKVKNKKKLVNRSFLIDSNGAIKTFYDKIHMFDVKVSKNEVYKESASFQSGKKIKLIKFKNTKIGFTICYDLRFPSLFRRLSKKGSEVILMPAAFTATTGKDHWEVLVRARAIENNAYLIATNMCGTHHTKRKTYGHSMIVSPDGKILKELGKREGVITAAIDPKKPLKLRKTIPSVYFD